MEMNLMNELKQMELFKEYREKFGLAKAIDSMGGVRKTRENSIVFDNGRVASVVTDVAHGCKYSIATCDYDGYFDWDILNEHGANDGCLPCNTELDILIACETIRRLPSLT